MNKILVVDDELNMRLVLSAMLKKEGFSDEEIHQLLVLNPAKAFTIRVRRI